MHIIALLVSIFLFITHILGNPITTPSPEVAVQINPGSTPNQRLSLFGGPFGAPIRKV